MDADSERQAGAADESPGDTQPRWGVWASGEGSIAAGGSIGLAIAGDYAAPMFVNLTTPLPAPGAYELPADKAPTANLPHNPYLFVGRQRELAALDATFKDNGCFVVHGLGGIGKSALAAHWAASRTNTFDLVWWITGDTLADLNEGLADLAVAFQPALSDHLSRKALCDLAVQWLCRHEGWLLVLDNVTDPADVKPLLARATNGRFLITTRRAGGWNGISKTLSLNVLDLPKAVKLFEGVHQQSAQGRSLPDPSANEADVRALCGELGCLPLAVGQAAAYCRESEISPGRYREQLTAHPEQLLAVAPEGGRTVALVWRVTLDRLADTPLAAEILRVIAWWAPDHIHRSYLTPLASAPEVTEAIRRLAAHSMITLRGEEISVHRLVQAVARTSSPEDPHRSPEEVTAGRETAAALLSTQVKDSAWAMQTSWFSHAETFLGHSDPDTEQSVLLLCHTQRWRRIFLEDGGIDEVEHVLAVAKRICGRRHTTTLLARYYVAEHHLELGNWLVARDLLIRNLFVTAWMFERNHPERIMASARLARPAFESGKFWAAVEMTDRANRRAERSLGPDHETTVKLGFWAAQNKLMLALRFPNLYTERAIDEVEQQIGRHDLAGDAAAGLIFSLVEFHVRTGDPARAIRTVEMFAPKLARSHGELHVSTLSLRCLQVELLIASGRDDSAKTLLAPLRNDWEQLLQDTRIPASLRTRLDEILCTLSP
ncbi:NB-ARC domain-containing protein [Streptomyces sp. NBC_00659]|uniref:NB-ARC domain-containing protein n=1 Tax=Streptomyces sp. NBC_00659 TaxID=2903669 RepID=UPI002E33955B|nr:NB-ARC domain-containing protein [Streptomyces sp. NBC_00659]